MRHLIVLCFLSLWLAACGPTAEVPTPLPTAVPPDQLPEQGIWAVSFKHEFPAGVFGAGRHRYAYLIHCPVISSEDTPTEWRFFEISEEALNQPTPLYLRIFGLSNEEFNTSLLPDDNVHPDREIVAVVHLVGLAKPVAEMAVEGCEVIVFWDDTGRQPLSAGEPFRP
jgi:hypothetical protein